LLKTAVAVVTLVALASSGAPAAELAAAHEEAAQVIVIRSEGGDMLATVPLNGARFAVSYRNSIYGTFAEERYVVLPDGRYRLVEVAADQLAVLEEYYAVPGAPRRAAETDRREWVAPPHPARPSIFETLSLAATDLGERTLHVSGEPPLELWRLVEDRNPFVALHIEERP
jgi:hypothetical protein